MQTAAGDLVLRSRPAVGPSRRRGACSSPRRRGSQTMTSPMATISRRSCSSTSARRKRSWACAIGRCGKPSWTARSRWSSSASRSPEGSRADLFSAGSLGRYMRSVVPVRSGWPTEHRLLLGGVSLAFSTASRHATTPYAAQVNRLRDTALPDLRTSRHNCGGLSCLCTCAPTECTGMA